MSRRTTLTVAAMTGLAACASSPFEMRNDPAAGALTVLDAGAPVLCYRYGDQLAEGVAADRTRSCYVHPIWGLDGEVLTDDFPKDHPHHRGLSLMWPRMRVGDRACELWHIRGLRTRFSQWLTRDTRADRAVLIAENHWTLDDGRQVARETAGFVIHRANERGRAIDVTFRIEVGDRPIELLGSKASGYGGTFLRFAPREQTRITTDRGPQPEDANLTRHRWADLSARFGGAAAPSGIAIFPAASHPGHPPPWTLRHYGGLGVSWPGAEPVVLAPGESVEFTHRLWIHRGDAREGRVAEAFADHRAAGD